MFNIFKQKKEYTPNKHIGETKRMGVMEDDYTIAMRREKDLASLRGQGPISTFTDSSGREIPIGQLNGQTEQLLREAREDIRREEENNDSLAAEGDINDNLPKIGKLNKVYKRDNLYDASFPESTQNFKTNSPAKRRLDIKASRKAHEKINWTTVDREDAFYEPDLIDEEIKSKLN